ncbi:MAG: mechanosensitive ion channel family protein [Flavobacteriales bacterium]
MTFDHVIWILGATAAGATMGFAMDRIALARLRRITLRSANGLDDIMVRAFKGILPLLGGVLGLRLAMRALELPVNLSGPMSRATFAAVVLALCVVAVRMATGALAQATRGLQGESRSASILDIILRAVIFSIGALVVLHDLGISITPMITALGLGGLAVALALQDTLSNLFAGLQLLASRQLGVGDFVKLESGEEGYLTDITWRNTTIRALSNHMIVVPNAKLAASIVKNYQRPDAEVAVLLEAGVSYESDLDHVERVTIATAREVVERLQPDLKEFDPFIRYNSFGDSNIGFSVIMRAAEFTGRYELLHEFIKALHRRYRKEGISIAYPTRTLKVDIPEMMHHDN